MCALGFIATVAGSSVCTPCARGTFGVNSSTCTLCDVGRFQDLSGETSCRTCSEVLNPSGRNLHLLSTMVLSDTVWLHVQGADDEGDCGCREGAWLSLARECDQCGEGMVCDGMGHVELEPGYFASYDNAGFVWRCHGDSARCPGGPPGTCAAHRKNTSIACGEFVTGTRVTTAGHCEACAGNSGSLRPIQSASCVHSCVKRGASLCDDFPAGASAI